LFPVVYQNQPVEALPVTGFPDQTAEANCYARRAVRYHAPAVTYGFVGRDVDILAIEKRLLSEDSSGKPRNHLLIHGYLFSPSSSADALCLFSPARLSNRLGHD
jgi:hypothetical protein